MYLPTLLYSTLLYSTLCLQAIFGSDSDHYHPHCYYCCHYDMFPRNN